jgi:membrane protease YdiL (CAAX protease family)
MSDVVDQPMRRSAPAWAWAGGSAAVLTLLLLGSSIGGEIGNFALAGFNVLPFAVLALLAYAGNDSFNWARLLTIVWLVLLVTLTLLISLGLGFAGAIERETPGALTDPATGLDPGPALLQTGIMLIVMLPGLLAGLLLLRRPLRAALARRLPIDPDRFTHTVALITVITLTWLLLVPYLVLGEPPLLLLLNMLPTDPEAAESLSAMIYGLLWTVPATIFAVGYAQTRSRRESLDRLGLVRPSLRQAGAGTLTALVMVGIVLLIEQFLPLLEPFFALFGWQRTDGEAFMQLLGPATPLSALVIGVTAGLGEELAVRGVLQPRVGLLFSNLFFTSLHAWQYGWDSLLIVFGVGMVFGVLRQRSNTSTAAIAHGVYNFTLMMLSWAGTTFGW